MAKIPFGQRIPIGPGTTVMLTRLDHGIIAEIRHTGPYHVGKARIHSARNKALFINSWNASYAKSRAKKYAEEHF